jgi:hypothetical protein
MYFDERRQGDGETPSLVQCLRFMNKDVYVARLYPRMWMMKKLLMIFLLAISSAAFGQGSQLSQLDGDWYSNQWKYGYTLTNGVGVATSTNSPNFKVGDRIIFLQQSSDKTFEGTQVYTDGKFYKITVQQQSNDTLFFKGEKNVSWTMTKKTQTSAQAATNTSSTSAASPIANSRTPRDQCENDAQKIIELRNKNYYSITAGMGCLNDCNSRYCWDLHARILQDLEQRTNKDLIYRPRVKDDVVSQALNYVSGYPEDGSGSTFWYPIKRQNGQCQFGMYTPLGVVYFESNVFDLNEGNPSAIGFFSQGSTYITRVEGLPEFRCEGCNGERVQRAWALIYKECKGTRKAF